jgi:hypothetical protein
MLIRRMAGVEEVEEEDNLDEMLWGGLPEVIVRAMELMKMMSLGWIMDVVRLFEVVECGQGCWYLPMKRTRETVGPQLVPD